MSRAWCRAILVAFAFCSAPVGAWAKEIGPCEREMGRASRLHGIPLGVLYAVGLTETGHRGSLQPYALAADGQTYFAANLREAMFHFETMRQQKIQLIDLGCMQINHYYHGAKFESVQAMFDPARNVDYAARFLKELREREGSWTMAVARYNAGPNNNPAQKKYICRVVNNLVTSGFGSWTEKAHRFCHADAVN